MRRALLLAAILLAVVSLVLWTLRADDMFRGAADARTDATDVEPADDAAAARRRERAKPEQARADPDASLPAFLRGFPEIGQDRGQDPALGALRGRVFLSQGVPADTFVVEAAVRAAVVARARVVGRGDFLLKNVPPGPGVGLTVRVEGFAPGGADRLLVRAGETTDVGTVFVGAAIDPEVDNLVDVDVVASGVPAARALVTVTSVPFRTLLALGSLEKQPGGTILRLETDEQGRASFARLPPGRYDVLAEADGMSFEFQEGLLVQRLTRAAVRLELRPGMTIEGRAVTEGDPQEPIAGARVVCLKFGGSFPMLPPTSTDADGRFVAKGLSAGPHVIVVAKEDVGGKEVQGVAAGTKDLVVVVPGGAELWVRCTDKLTGAPVREFGLRPIRKTPFAYLFSPLFEAKTEDGVYRLKILPSADYGLEVVAPGYALATLPKVTLPCTAPIEVQLDPAGVVRGRVVAKIAQTPIRGAAVFLKRGGFPPSRAKDQQTVTDAEGLFVLGNLPASPVDVTISHADHGEMTFEAVVPVTVAPGAPAPSPRTFALGDGGRVAGRVLGAGGAPAVGQRVVLAEGFNFGASREATTAEGGAYAFDNVPPGDKYAISVGASAGRPARSRRDIRVVEGETTTVDFTDAGGARLAGRVVRGEEPVAGASLTVVGEGGSSYSATARSGDDGAFAFDAVPPGAYVIQARHASGARVMNVPVAEGQASVDLVISLAAAASIAGKVVDGSNGQPLSAAWCDCTRVATTESGGLGDLVRASSETRTTGNDGVFRFATLEPGTYRVRVIRDGFGVELSDDLTVAAGESREGLVLSLVPACTVAGRVRDSQGVAVSEVAVLVRDAQGRRLSSVSLTSTAGDGTYVQGSLRPGTYEFTFEKNGWAPAVRTVTVSAAERSEGLDVTLFRGGRIEVSVTDEDGAGVAGAVVSLYDAAGNRVTRGLTVSSLFSSNAATTDASGRVVLSGTAPGTYELRAARPGAAEVRRSGVEVSEGGTTGVTIVLPARVAE